MASQWWFQVIRDQTLRFRSPRSAEAVRVLSVVPDDNEKIIVTVVNENDECSRETVGIQDFVGVEMTFQVLEDAVDSIAFCRTLMAIMRGKGFDFFERGQPLMSSPRTVKKYEYKCPYPFQEQVESAGDCEQLDSRNRVWRLAAQRAMHFKGSASAWGGHFKEAIVVSCLSRRCYTMVRAIIATRRTMFMKVTRFLFRGFCGCRDEGLMYALLKRWDQGDISPTEVNERLKEEKESSRPITEVEVLRKQNAELEAMVSELQTEVRNLKSQLAKANRPTGCDREAMATVSASVSPLQSTSAGPPVMFTERLYAFSEIEADQESDQESVLSVTEEPVVKRPRYTVCYKPDSESDLDDSREDPDWKVETEEPNDNGDDDDDDIDLNSAFLSVSEWNPRDVPVKIEIPDKADDAPGVTTENFLAEQVDDRQLVTEIEEPVEKQTSTKARPRRSLSSQGSLSKGKEVLGLFINGGRDKWQEWCPCTIVEVLMNGDLFSVSFSDGAKRFLKKHQIKEKE